MTRAHDFTDHFRHPERSEGSAVSWFSRQQLLNGLTGCDVPISDTLQPIGRIAPMRRPFSLALTAIALSAAASTATAQRGGFGRGGQPQTPGYPDPPALSFPTPDPVIKRIWSIGMD